MKEMKEYLREGETIRWQGQPEAFPLMENGSKGGILRTWLITVILVGGLLMAYISNNPNWSSKFVGAVVIIGVLILCSPLMEKSKIAKQKYYITDQRAIAVLGSEFYAMELSDLDAFEIVRDVANQNCLVLGSSIFSKMQKQMRWLACHPQTNRVDNDKKGSAEALVFYGISNAAAAAGLLSEEKDGCVA